MELFTRWFTRRGLRDTGRPRRVKSSLRRFSFEPLEDRRVMDADSLNLIGVDDFRANPSFDQFNGAGPTTSTYSIAIVGPGAQLNHPDLGPDQVAPIGIADRIVYQQNFAEPGTNANETDENGKGTGAASI